jgi:hypothetical protein
MWLRLNINNFSGQRQLFLVVAEGHLRARVRLTKHAADGVELLAEQVQGL